MRIRSALGLAGVTLALGTTPAVAQDPGVFIDPGSPSAKEYALPFESERRQADPGTPQEAAIPQGQRVSPAFGEGIEPIGAHSNAGTSGSSSTAGGTDSAESTRSGGGSGNGATSADGGAAEATIRAATANPGAPGGDAGSTFAIAGVALLVLLAGLAAGFVLRRRRT
jgi:hypothetical protein